MEVYKYKVFKSVKSLDETKLNQVGRAGWQLCGVTQDEYGYVYYLKKLDASMGKYIIMGNHDNTKEEYIEIVAKSGFTNLNENYETLYYKSNEPILIAGMSTGEYSNKTPQEKVNNAITEIKQKEITI